VWRQWINNNARSSRRSDFSNRKDIFALGTAITVETAVETGTMTALRVNTFRK
jgi:hypothetical protein